MHFATALSGINPQVKMKTLLSNLMLVTVLLPCVLPAAAPATPARAILRLEVDGDQDLANRTTELLAAVLRDEANLEIVTASRGADFGEQFDLELICRIRRSGYRVTTVVVNAGDQSVIARESVTGNEEEIFGLIDQLGHRLVSAVNDKDATHNAVAVLDFRNDAGADSGPLASGLPDMLMTAMRQSSELTLVERAAKSSSNLSMSEVADLSRWLGAELAVTGSLTDMLHIQLEATSAKSGFIESAQRVGPRTAVADLTSAVAADLASNLGSRFSRTRTVAVLPFANHGDDRFDPLVQGLPDMLTTTLEQAAELTIIERVQIDKALRNFKLEMSGPIDSDTALEVGAWLGADAVIVGSFLRFGRVFRIDARMIDAATGEVMIAQSARGGEEEVLAMVDTLGHKLQQRFDEREGNDNQGTGTLQVVFRTAKSEMGERPVYHHLCKLYVDGDYVGLSPVVDQAAQWTLLFDKNLRTGTHRVDIVHGYVRDGVWDGRMPEQPRRFHFDVEMGGVSTIKYSFNVGWFSDEYDYEP